MNRQIPWLAYFLAVVNATIIGLSFMFTKIAVTECAPFDTLAFRFLIGFVVFFIYAKIARIPLDFRGKPWIRLLPIVFFYPIGFFTFQAFGMVHIPSSEAGILTASAPILTAVLAAVLIKERTNLLQFLSIGVSILGVLFIALMKGNDVDPEQVETTRTVSTHALGIILILLSCLSSAGYTICNRVLVRSFSAGEITFVLMSAGVVFFSGMALAEHLWTGAPITTMLAPLGNVKFVFAILYLGIFASLLTTILASLILKRISSSQLVIFFNLSTVVAIIAGKIFLDEPIHLYHLIGTAIIIAGVVGTNYFKKS